MPEVREARRRLIFSEFFLMELAVWPPAAQHAWPRTTPRRSRSPKRSTQHIRARFPYAFTAAQDKSIGRDPRPTWPATGR